MKMSPPKDHSGGDDRSDMIDEKKRKRMISNRESARRSRMKKEQHIKDLNDQVFFLMNKRDEMVRKIDHIAKGFAAIESDNLVLRSQKEELEKRLEYAKIVSNCYVGDHGMVHVQEPWVRPWEQHQPPQSMPIMSSAGFFQF